MNLSTPENYMPREEDFGKFSYAQPSIEAMLAEFTKHRVIVSTPECMDVPTVVRAKESGNNSKRVIAPAYHIPANKIYRLSTPPVNKMPYKSADYASKNARLLLAKLRCAINNAGKDIKAANLHWKKVSGPVGELTCVQFQMPFAHALTDQGRVQSSLGWSSFQRMLELLTLVQENSGLLRLEVLNWRPEEMIAVTINGLKPVGFLCVSIVVEKDVNLNEKLFQDFELISLDAAGRLSIGRASTLKIEAVSDSDNSDDTSSSEKSDSDNSDSDNSDSDVE